MKRKIAITVAVIVLILAIATVGVVLALENKDNTNTDPQQPGETQNYTINIVVPDGSPAIALAKMINDNDAPKDRVCQHSRTYRESNRFAIRSNRCRIDPLVETKQSRVRYPW